MKKSIRKPIELKNKPIKINSSGRTEEIKKKNNLTYLKQRYSYHYKKGNWERANEYSEYSIQNYQMDLKEWMENKELSKMNNKNIFGFDNPKKLKYG
jgi:hypothetical protein|tara:strand:+ start:102 stop:392 length:291 start_codon:yes stop_codon:yes gene_type:complete